MTQHAVALAMLGITAAILIWDIYLATDDTKANTISAVSRRIGKMWPFTRIVIPFAMGVVVGHIWWT